MFELDCTPGVIRVPLNGGGPVKLARVLFVDPVPGPAVPDNPVADDLVLMVDITYGTPNTAPSAIAKIAGRGIMEFV